MTNNHFYVYGFDASKVKCGYCIKATELLESEGHDFIFYDISGEKDGTLSKEAQTYRNNLQERLGRNNLKDVSVPQIFMWNGEHVGGYTELKAYFKDK